MAAYWCVNFDAEEQVLGHGIEESLWLMQYQYSHDGYVYQGGENQIASTSKNWNALRAVSPGGNRSRAGGDKGALREQISSDTAGWKGP
jgi:hypothetical protein